MFKKPDKSSAGSSGIKLPLIQKLKPPRRSTFVQTKLPKLKTKPLIEGKLSYCYFHFFSDGCSDSIRLIFF